MDEKQLRDLLDEAYSYKKFSDRDSKSKIFKVTYFNIYLTGRFLEERNLQMYKLFYRD